MPRLLSHNADELASEMDALTRQHDALITETRVAWLDARIAEQNGLAVRKSRTSVTGDRVTLRLEAGDSIELDLLSPKRARLATVGSVRRRCNESWIVRGRTSAGEHVTYVCARVRITPVG